MTSKEQIAQFLEGLELFGVRVYPMMGDYVVYFGEKPVGCVCDNRLFIKETPGLPHAAALYGCKAALSGGKLR